MIGYGAMLCEGWVGLTSLIAATALFPEDYFAINVSPERFMKLGMTVVNLPELSQQVGEAVAGRTGGAVSLAVGMAQVFSSIPGLRQFMAYWYHFAILFEALFILTTIDSGTRVARFLVQEFLGKIKEPWGRSDWLPGSILSTVAVVFAWAGFIWTGSISTIWPSFWYRESASGLDFPHYRNLLVGSLRKSSLRLGHVASPFLCFNHDRNGRF